MLEYLTLIGKLSNETENANCEIRKIVMMLEARTVCVVILVLFLPSVCYSLANTTGQI